MSRRILSTAGQRRQRIGRKAIATTRVAASIARHSGNNDETMVSSKRTRKITLPTISYTFRRWHAVTATFVVVIGIGTSVFVNFQHQQAVAAEKIRVAAAEKAAVENEKKQQACLADVTAKKQSQVGKLTFDQLYDGLCG